MFTQSLFFTIDKFTCHHELDPESLSGVETVLPDYARRSKVK